jgi:L-2-hydroxyglutarate oxidase LhgO
MLYELCPREGIPLEKRGKLIVAIGEEDLPTIERLKKRAEENGVEGLRLLEPPEIRKLEPEVRAAGALWSSETGIIDSHALMAYLEKKASAGSTFAYNCVLTGLEKGGEGYLVTIRDADGESYRFGSRVVINSAGLGAEEVAKLAGIDTEAAGYVIHPCKGEYFRVRGKKKLFSRLVYPPPTEISLGLHTVVDLQGGMKLGPSAYYVDEIDYGVREENRDDFYRKAKKYLPGLKREDLSPDMAGIRPKLYRKGEAERDFIIRREDDRGLPGLIDLVGIESPGLTAALAIGKHVAGMVEAIGN